MKPHDEPQSPLAPTIARYVAVKRALGRRFDKVDHCLTHLDHFLASRGAPDLTTEAFAAWCPHPSGGEWAPPADENRLPLFAVPSPQ